MRDKFLIIDGSSLIHRAFYAWPLLTNKKGEFTNAVYGLAIMMNKVLEQIKPVKVGICFDKSRITFRTAIYGEYKGGRSETPAELKPQFDLAKVLMDKMGITWEETENYEADDIIGTLSRLGSVDYDVVILTGDRDSFQLIGEHTKVMLTKKGITNTEIWDENALMERYGLTPEKMIDLKSLMGDASDNIPGIAGVGEKTALKLLAEFGDFDNVIANAENIKAKGLRTKVMNGIDSALMSRKLAVIDRHMEEVFPQFADLERYNYNPKPLRENNQLTDFYKEMNFVSLLKAVSEPTAPQTEKTSVNNDFSGGLFADSADISITDANIDLNKLAADLNNNNIITVCLYKKYIAVKYNKNGKKEIAVISTDMVMGCLALRRVFADENIEKLCWQGKALVVELGKYGIAVNGITDDIELMAYLLDPEAGSYEPYVLAEKYSEGDIINEKNYDERQLATLCVDFTDDLKPILAKHLQDLSMYKLYKEIEMPLSLVLVDMELNGILVDKNVLRETDVELSAMEAELTSKIYDLAGRSFNINSPKQLGEVLFVELGIPPIKKTKTGFSTNQEVMEKLKAEYPIAEYVLRYRTVSKLRSTYAVGLQNLIGTDGKIHTSFNQTVTATGRLSSTEPNLQNIPVRDEMGRKLRRAFKPTEGNVLVSADYSQIELRVLAHIADDKVLQSSFINNEDIHARTAAEVFGVSIDNVTAEQRRRAKAVNFGIVYGISEYGLARDLGITRAEGKEYIEKYLAGYDGVRFYMKNIVEQGKEKGYVETLLGRKRKLPDLNNRNYNLRSFAERTALNTPIQGTAADIMKIAMIKVAERLKKEKLQSKMLLQVHDELILDVPLAEKEQVAALLKEEMEQAFDLAVPMTADVKIGYDWYNMKTV